MPLNAMARLPPSLVTLKSMNPDCMGLAEMLTAQERESLRLSFLQGDLQTHILSLPISVKVAQCTSSARIEPWAVSACWRTAQSLVLYIKEWGWYKLLSNTFWDTQRAPKLDKLESPPMHCTSELIFLAPRKREASKAEFLYYFWDAASHSVCSVQIFGSLDGRDQRFNFQRSSQLVHRHQAKNALETSVRFHRMQVIALQRLGSYLLLCCPVLCRNAFNVALRSSLIFSCK